ncbi:MAG: response regulator, partial [Firmicutes bacterium]|nr:response regulator [Bacillota bacterium]
MIDIVLVEDNQELATLMKDLLIQKGFSVCHFESGEAFLKWLSQKENTPKMIILDVMLPLMDGFFVCQEIRKKGNIPILMMSAKTGKSNQLLGFELGADDYLE